MLRLSRLSWSLLLVAAAVSSAGAASPVQVSVTIDHKPVSPGQPVPVTVQVRNCDTRPEVRPPTSSDYVVIPAGNGTTVPSALAGVASPAPVPQVQGPTGQTLGPAIQDLSRSALKDIRDPVLLQNATGGDPLADLHRKDYTFFYLVKPKTAGNLVLAPFTVTVGGQTFTSQPIALTENSVQSVPLTGNSVEAENPLHLALSLSNPNPTIGEEVQLYVDLLLPRAQVAFSGTNFPHIPVANVQVTLPALDQSPQLEWARPLQQVIDEAPVPANQGGIRINNFSTQMALPKGEPPDQAPELDWYRRRLAFPVRIKQAGKIQIPPAVVVGDIYAILKGSGSNRVVAKTGWTPFRVATEPLALEVFDVASRPNRPKEFSGAIGELHVTASASQTTLPLGTPFTLTVRVEGRGSLGQMTPPDLAGQPEFTQSFKVRLDGDRITPDKAREFTYTLRPLSEDVTTIPPVRVTYFSPQADGFQTTQSPPIPVKVTPAGHVGGETADSPAAGVLNPVEDLEDWQDSPLLQVGLWSLAGMLTAFLAVRYGRKLWRRLPRPEPARVAERQRRKEATTIRRQFPSSVVTADSVRRSFCDYLRARFGLPPGEITPADVLEHFERQGIDGGLARECADLLDHCTMATFGRVAVAADQCAATARRLMAALDRQQPRCSWRPSAAKLTSQGTPSREPALMP